jgi:hypothetical protein
MLTRHAVILGALAAAVVIPLAAARAGPNELVAGQILPPGPPATPIPTTPCPTCGPTGAGPNVTFRAWAYPLHFCPSGTSFLNQTFVEGSALYAIVYGLGANMTVASATFFAEINGTVRQLDTLTPGERDMALPAVVVPPGVSFLAHLWATTDGTQTGPRVQFGNGSTERPMTLACFCPTPTPQTTPSTPPSSPSSSSPTTTPGEATSVPPVHTVPGTGAIPPSR